MMLNGGWEQALTSQFSSERSHFPMLKKDQTKSKESLVPDVVVHTTLTTLLKWPRIMLINSLSDQEEKAVRAKIIRNILPSCQPQEGSPANTFTASEIEELKTVFPDMQLGPCNHPEKKLIDIRDADWSLPQDTKPCA